MSDTFPHRNSATSCNQNARGLSGATITTRHRVLIVVCRAIMKVGFVQPDADAEDNDLDEVIAYVAECQTHGQIAMATQVGCRYQTILNEEHNTHLMLSKRSGAIYIPHGRFVAMTRRAFATTLTSKLQQTHELFHKQNQTTMCSSNVLFSCFHGRQV